MTLSKTTGLATSRCLSTQFPVLVHCIADPIDFGISTDGLKRKENSISINKNKIVILKLTNNSRDVRYQQ